MDQNEKYLADLEYIKKWTGYAMETLKENKKLEESIEKSVGDMSKLKEGVEYDLKCISELRDAAKTDLEKTEKFITSTGEALTEINDNIKENLKKLGDTYSSQNNSMGNLTKIMIIAIASQTAAIITSFFF